MNKPGDEEQESKEVSVNIFMKYLNPFLQLETNTKFIIHVDINSFLALTQ